MDVKTHRSALRAPEDTPPCRHATAWMTFQRLLLLPLLVLLLPLAACEQPVTPLKVGSNQWPGYEPVYLARELAYLDESEIKLVEMPAASDVMQQLRDHNLDGGMLTLDEVIALASEGLNMRVVLVMDFSDGADAILAHPSIGGLKQLKGKRIGVELSAVGALMLESALEKAELRKSDVTLINLTVDRQEQAYRNQEVDAVITFEPTRTKLLAEGAHELFSSREIPGRIIDVLAIREERVTPNEDTLRNLISAHFRALEYLQQHPEQALPLIAPRLGINKSELQAAYHGLKLPGILENHDWLADDADPLEKRSLELATLMRRWDLIRRTPDLTQLADNRYLPMP